MLLQYTIFETLITKGRVIIMMERRVVNIENAFTQVKNDIIDRNYEFEITEEGIVWSIGRSWYYREFLIPCNTNNDKYNELCNIILFMSHAVTIAESRYKGGEN